MSSFKLVLQPANGNATAKPTEQMFIIKICRTTVSVTIWWRLYGFAPPPPPSIVLNQLVTFQQCEYNNYVLFAFVYYYVNARPQSACRSSIKLLTPQFRQQWKFTRLRQCCKLHDTEESHIRLWIGSFHWSAIPSHPSATYRCQPLEYDAIHQRCDSVTLWHAVSLA